MSHLPASEEHVRNPVRPSYPLEGGGPEEQEEEEEEEERAQESRQIKTRVLPKGPTADQWRRHRIRRYPFRSWCPHGVAGRAKSWPRLRREAEEEPQAPEEAPPALALAGAASCEDAHGSDGGRAHDGDRLLGRDARHCCYLQWL